MNELIITANRELDQITWNREELTTMVDTITKQYEGLVYTEAQVPEAKKDRANLNKALAAIETERKRIKSAVIAPYDRFEAELKELTGKIKATIDGIDEQIKDYEGQRKAEKKAQLEAHYEEQIGSLRDMVPFAAIFDEKMLNATVTVEKAALQITEKIEKITNDLRALDGIDSEFKTEIKSYYLQHFDLGRALERNSELTRLKQQEEARKQEEEARRKAAVAAAGAVVDAIPEQPAKAPTEAQGKAQEASPELEMTFTVWGTLDQLRALKAFMDERGLKYK